MLLLGAGIELAERGIAHYAGDHFPGGPREPSANMAVGILATAFGWWVGRCVANPYV
jgi:hypothetical protein